MCGIVGYVGRRECAPILMEGLARVEYRGYDSAGIAVVAPSGALRVHRKAGKLRELEQALPRRLAGRAGIGHTRWATHGEPSDRNAHPHVDAANRIAVVHNGILENYAELRRALEDEGVTLASDTDTECLAHLIAREKRDGHPLEEAVRRALAQVEGAYGLVVLDADQPDRLVAARNGSPVIVGVGEREMLVASDTAALVRHTDRVVHLADGEIAAIEADGYRTFALDATPTESEAIRIGFSVEDLDRAGHDTFMAKEIAEQPDAILRALAGRIDERFATARLGGISLTPREVLGIRRVKLLGCGSALYAAMAGARLIEELARIPADAEAASEFRYRNPVVEPDVLYVAISQSGETADTLAAVQEVQRKGGRVLGVVNAVGSSIARECEGIYLHAGPEVSVASTKAFTSMVVNLALLALQLGRVRDMGLSDGGLLIRALRELPGAVAEVLAQEDELREIGEELSRHPSAFFIGRGRTLPVALEGAQKLKEISYVHAEAYPASELKHGPLALVGPEFPVVAILADDELLDKNVSTVQQVRARHAPVIGIVQARGRQLDDEGTAAGEPLFDHVVSVPAVHPSLDPILLTIPLQVIAMHAAAALGRDVDQPRNLAKSVTVE